MCHVVVSVREKSNQGKEIRRAGEGAQQEGGI